MPKTLTLNDLISRVSLKIADVAPDNISQTPIALSYEREDNGDYIWAAYIEIQCEWTEFDIRATSKFNAQNALAKAFTRFRQELARA